MDNYEYVLRMYERYRIPVVMGVEDMNSAYVFYEEKQVGNISSVRVEVGKDIEHKEAALLHELGHIKHPMGLSGEEFDALTRELAANTWAIKNIHPSSDKNEILYHLSAWVQTYMDDGYIYAQDTPELRGTAKTLGIDHMIHWYFP